MPAKKKSIVSNIKGYDTSAVRDVKDLISFAKRAAKLANNRLYKLEKAGLTSKATTGGIKHISLADIRDKKTAVEAIGKARSLVSNPLSTVGQVHKLYREAAKEYMVEGEPSRFKIIAVAERVEGGAERNRYKLVPKAVPIGTNEEMPLWEDAKDAVKKFWDWYDKYGSMYYDSETAYQIVDDNNYNYVDALEDAQDYMDDLKEELESSWDYFLDEENEPGDWIQ